MLARYLGATALLAASAAMIGAAPIISFSSGKARSVHHSKPSVSKKAKTTKIRHKARVGKTAQHTLTLPLIGPDANLNGKSIEIDGGNNGANAYPRSSRSTIGIYDAVNFPASNLYTFLNLSALNQDSPADIILNIESSNNPTIIDWVKDMLPNTDAASLQDGIAQGIIPNNAGEDANGNNAQTGVGDPTLPSHPVKGHWYGQRVVDGIAGDEHNIFIKGGKENEPQNWNVGPGSVGSSKYDITQVFLANTNYPTADTVNFPSGFKDVLLFAMERRGNNGTTAFDFEFNQHAPDTDYIPHRTDGDVLFTFEMQGSSTNVAIPHIYLYKSSIPGFDLAHDLAGTLGAKDPKTTMNFGNTPSAPWGHVDAHGDWKVEPIDNAEFCEALAYYGPDTNILPFISRCGGVAFVQIRTRSSTTENSDLKDTTKFFKYQFPQPLSGPAKRLACAQGFYFDGLSSSPSIPNDPLTYVWKFTVSDPSVTLTGDGFSLSYQGNGVYLSPTFSTPAERHVIASNVPEAGIDVTAELTVNEGGTCSDTKSLSPFKVSPDVAAASPTLTGSCNTRTLNFSGLITGGSAPITYQWDVYKVGNSTPVYTKAGSSQTVHVATSDTFTPSADGQYYVVLSAHDSRFDPNNPTVCAVSPQSVNVCAYGAINPQASKLSADGAAQKVKVHSTFLDVSAACGSTTVQWQRFNGTSWVDIASANTADFDYSTFEADVTPTATTFSIGSDSYAGKLYTVQLRVHVTRSINGQQCSDDSAAITVKKVIAVDP